MIHISVHSAVTQHSVVRDEFHVLFKPMTEFCYFNPMMTPWLHRSSSGQTQNIDVSHLTYGQKRSKICITLSSVHFLSIENRDMVFWRERYVAQSVTERVEAPHSATVPPDVGKSPLKPWRKGQAEDCSFTRKRVYFFTWIELKSRKWSHQANTLLLKTCSRPFLSQRSQTFILKYPLVGWLNVFNAPHPCTLLSMCETETGIRWAPLIFHTTCYFTLKKTTTICWRRNMISCVTFMIGHGGKCDLATAKCPNQLFDFESHRIIVGLSVCLI